MPAILAPQPKRLLPVLATHVPQLPLDLDDPFICHTPVRERDALQYPRLLSPIRLDRTKRALMTKSPTPCASVKRPSTTHAPRTPRRRRHYARTPDFPSVPRPRAQPAHIDIAALPWIHALDDAPSDDPWDADLADLSQLVFDGPTRPPVAPGPIRRRKTSARSAHLPPRRADTLALAALVDARGAAATPPPRFPRPSDVAFWNLMPVVTPPSFAPASP